MLVCSRVVECDGGRDWEWRGEEAVGDGFEGGEGDISLRRPVGTSVVAMGAGDCS